MAKLSELKRLCAERDAAMTDDERKERNERHKRTTEHFMEQHQRMLAPIRRLERLLGPTLRLHEVAETARAMEEALAPVRALREASLPDLGLMRELANSPVVTIAQELAQNPVAQIARDLATNSAFLTAHEELSGRYAAQELGLSFPELAGVDRLRELTRGLADTSIAQTPTFRPEMFAPVRPTRDTDQDERFQQLAEVVSAQTDQIVELRREVREVKDSASRDAHRGRAQAIQRDSVDVRLRWWHLVLASLLSAILTAAASALFT